MYGQTLTDIVEQSQIDSTGVSLSVDAALLEVKPAPAVGSGVSDDDEDDAPTIEWDGVAVKIACAAARPTEAPCWKRRQICAGAPEDIQWITFGWLMIAADDAVSVRTAVGVPHRRLRRAGPRYGGTTAAAAQPGQSSRRRYSHGQPSHFIGHEHLRRDSLKPSREILKPQSYRRVCRRVDETTVRVPREG